LKSTFVAIAAVSLVGCASIMNDTTQGVRFETKTAAGVSVAGADCKISNDYGSSTVKSGDTSQVRRSSKDMDIVCTHTSQPEAKGRAISRANAGLAGNIIFGGGIGAIIDHSKGTAYTYPTWIELVFGQSLVFDRMDEHEGRPLTGKTSAAMRDAARPVQSNYTSMVCAQGAVPCTK